MLGRLIGSVDGPNDGNYHCFSWSCYSLLMHAPHLPLSCYYYEHPHATIPSNVHKHTHATISSYVYTHATVLSYTYTHTCYCTLLYAHTHMLHRTLLYIHTCYRALLYIHTHMLPYPRMHKHTVVPRTISGAVRSSPVRVTSSAPQVSLKGFITHGFSLEEERTHRWRDVVG